MKPLNFGLIGLGRFGVHYARLLQQMKGVKLSGVACRTKKTLTKAERELPKSVFKTTDASKLLKRKEIDCVVIATPVSEHFALAKKALECNKNVLLEKPMVQNFLQAKKLRELVKKSNRTFMVGHQFVFNDYINFIKKNLKKMCGKTNFVFAEHFYPGPVRKDIGCFWDAGTHQLSVLQYLFNPGKIVQVSGFGVGFKSGFDEFSQVSVDFEKNLTATLIVSWLAQEKRRKFSFIGAKKTFLFDALTGKEQISIFPTNKPTLSEHLPKIKAKEPLLNQLEHFVYCIKNKKTPATGIDKSFQITEWLQKISKSINLEKH